MLSSTFFKSLDAQAFQRAISESRIAAAFRTSREASDSTRIQIRRWVDGKFVTI